MSLPPPIPIASPHRLRAVEFWSRHWKWVVPGIGVALFLLLALVIGALIYVITAAVKSSDVYRDALRSAKADTHVVQALGTPITEAFLPDGSISYVGDIGEAHFSVGLHGPRGSGSVQVDATRRHGRWTYQTLTFAGPHGDPMNLSPATSATPVQSQPRTP
ncbi:cytochrome c oxidase assembly factor Coa1 family protein [Xanthomonas sp. WHRI 10064A]|uniref:cytochrome c oxidase assembly factor Coa1 family protein n=1 Tax=unclassified Xanthomonas TaxID=2643310 RepID=UPI002B225C26|nr:MULTISPECIES: cytochrome c oxidase assembly factor Coa1 family protein [unclassified Xanthomonas]MEA9589292.1 cytochrome c oxidase assembly factor Coa1 family protein [Xanthomonas sp. WHRI 10064B]MEA9616785.1 cytochrome c oxidase assembly factor Coa1 family protein [Xanthomonas sp. WHRI 10064A]